MACSLKALLLNTEEHACAITYYEELIDQAIDFLPRPSFIRQNEYSTFENVQLDGRSSTLFVVWLIFQA